MSVDAAGGGDPVADLSALISQLTGTDPAAADEGDDEADNASGDDAPQPAFGDVDEWIREYLAAVLERKVAQGAQSGIYWCAEWWRHPEAISRLYALWRAWETLRLDPTTGMSVWWRDHLEPHLAVLTSDGGPFRRCSPGQHHDTTSLPVTPAPADVLAALPDAATE